MQDDLQARQGETVPVMRISLRADTPADTQRAIADGVHRAMVDALGLPEADRFQIIERVPAEALIADPGYLGVSRRNVGFVNLTLVPRRPRSSRRSPMRSRTSKPEKPRSPAYAPPATA